MALKAGELNLSLQKHKYLCWALVSVEVQTFDLISSQLTVHSNVFTRVFIGAGRGCCCFSQINMASLGFHKLELLQLMYLRPFRGYSLNFKSLFTWRSSIAIAPERLCEVRLFKAFYKLFISLQNDGRMWPISIFLKTCKKHTLFIAGITTINTTHTLRCEWKLTFK